MSLNPSTTDSTIDKKPNVETLAKRYLHFLTSGAHADITLIVGKDKIPIKAHKLILTLGSSYFEELLTQGKEEFLSSKTGQEKELNIGSAGDSGLLNHSASAATERLTDKQMDSLVIDDVEPDDFDLFLQFLYSRSAPDDINTALPLLMCAKKFNVPSLIEAAGNLLKQSLNLKSALTILEQAMHFKCQDLQISALNLICENGYKILESATFLDLSEETVGLILQKDELRAYDEMQVFEATIRWAHAECGRKKMDPTNVKYIRSVLELLLKFIRFPLMNASEFKMSVSPLKLLTTEERVDILEALITTDADAPRFSEFFRTVERLYYIPETQVVKVGGASASLSSVDLVSVSDCRFKVNKSVWISKIGFCSWYTVHSYTLPILVSLILENACVNDKPAMEHQETDYLISATPSWTSESVEFKTPVKIRAGVWYSITANFYVQAVQGYREVSCEVYAQQSTGIRKVVCAEGVEGDDDPLCFEFESSGTGIYDNNGQIAEIGYKLGK